MNVSHVKGDRKEAGGGGGKKKWNDKKKGKGGGGRDRIIGDGMSTPSDKGDAEGVNKIKKVKLKDRVVTLRVLSKATMKWVTGMNEHELQWEPS